MVTSLRRIDGEVTRFGGVCAGLAYYFQTPLYMVRLLFLVTALVSGIGIFMYICLLVVLPKMDQPKDFDKVTEGY